MPETLMTRNQAEAAGWRLFTPERSEGCKGLVFMDANNNRHRLYSWGLSEQEAVDSILDAITAIERYGALEAENARLRDALRPLVESWSHLELSPGPGQYELFIEADDVYAAVKAMEESDAPQG